MKMPNFSIGDENAAIKCPNELKYRIFIENSGGAEWAVAGEEQIMPLKGGRLFFGPVREDTVAGFNQITPTPFINRERGEFRQEWVLEDNMFAAGILLVCDYAGTSRFLMHAVPKTLTECREVTVLEDEVQQRPQTMHVFCR
jgi:hypothetical protein